MFDLTRYRQRIRDEGPLDADSATLRRLHRNHLHAIVYENLDVLRGVPVSLDPDAAYEKIVVRGRGGWCYEMNGLFARALRAAGFAVDLVGAMVGERAQHVGQLNHLALIVHCPDGPWLSDVGLGNGAPEPLPLREGESAFGPFSFRLEWLADRWRFHMLYEEAGFDFTTMPRALAEFEEPNRWLQTDPDSGFVQNARLVRYTPEGYLLLRGKVLTNVTSGPSNVTGAPFKEERIISDRTAYEAQLRETYALDLEIGDDVWRRIEERHAEWEREQRAVP